MTEDAIARFLHAQWLTALWCELEGRRSSYRTLALEPDLPDWPARAQLDQALEASVMEAIHVNPYDCIQWLVVATVNGPMSFILPLIPPSDYEPGLRVDS